MVQEIILLASFLPVIYAVSGGETIGFVIPFTSHRFDQAFFTEFIVGVGEELSSWHFDLLVSNATTDDGECNLYQATEAPSNSAMIAAAS